MICSSRNAGPGWRRPRSIGRRDCELGSLPLPAGGGEDFQGIPRLTSYAWTLRYPAEPQKLETPEAEAEQAFETAKLVLDEICGRLPESARVPY